MSEMVAFDEVPEKDVQRETNWTLVFGICLLV
jgi:hypothetical protein